MKVLLCASEVVPFAKTGGLADVAGALPKALAALGHEVRVAMPRYGSVDGEKFGLKAVGSVKAPLGGKSVMVGVEASEAIAGVTTYLFDSPEHFRRKALYGEPDDGERFGLFCRAVIEFLRRSEWRPQVIHVNDWQTSLIPVYLRANYAKDKAVGGIATLCTVHNLAYQGVFDRGVMEKLGLDRSLFTVDGLEFWGQVSFLKGGLLFADLVSTVSPRYAREIQTAEFGERLEGVLQKRGADLFGVLNGLDYEEWNPATDELIAARYDASDTTGKGVCRQALQERLGLPRLPEAPVFGFVSRLAGQKGLDLVAEVLPSLLQLGVQLALLGTGEPYYHQLLSELARQNPDKMALVLGFDNALAHQIYAGSDMFLMPSHYEPCGLGQMISLRYGTIPVVRETGGLADTVSEFNAQTGEGNGFLARERSSVAVFGAIARALLTMQRPNQWAQLMRNAMACDFSWGRSAEEYVRLYQLAIERGRR